MDSVIKSSKASKAFTLVEVMISLVLASILLAAVLRTNILLLKSQSLSALYVDMSAQSRKAVELMADDVRQMSSITINSAGFSGQVPDKTGTGNVSLSWQYDAVLGRVTRSFANNSTVIWSRVMSCQFNYYGAGSMDSSSNPPRMIRGSSLPVGTNTKVKQVQITLTTRATALQTAASQQTISAQFSARP